MPQVPYDVLDEIRALRQEVRDLYGRLGIRPAMNQILAGDVTIGAGGTLVVQKVPSGEQLRVGRIFPNHVDGSEQRGVLIYREDGTLAVSLATVGPEAQGLVLRDAHGNTIFAEDVAAGGLSVGVFGSSGWYGATEVPQWTTTSSSFSTCMSLRWRKQHPKVEAHYLARCSDGSTSGEIRLVDGSGAVVSQISLSAGAYQLGSATGPVTGAHLGTQTLVWQARVTGGSGSVGVTGLSTFGVGS